MQTSLPVENVSICLTKMTVNDLEEVRQLAVETWGNQYNDKFLWVSEKVHDGLADKWGFWVARLDSNENPELVGYHIAHPCTVEELPLEEHFKSQLTRDQLMEKMYFIDESVVQKRHQKKWYLKDISQDCRQRSSRMGSEKDLCCGPHRFILQTR